MEKFKIKELNLNKLGHPAQTPAQLTTTDQKANWVSIFNKWL